MRGLKDGKSRPRSGLGFFYPSEAAPYLDAKEYEALLSSGRLSEEESAFLRQFLKEYYGRCVKSEVLINQSYEELSAAQERRRFDAVTAKPRTKALPRYAKAKTLWAYSESDYSGRYLNPEELFLFREELSIKRKDKDHGKKKRRK